MSRIDTIQQEVCERYGISLNDMLGPRRSRQLIKPRWLAMAIVQDLLPDQSYPMIGNKFGKRDHTTALYAIRGINKMRQDAEFDREYHELRESVSAMINPTFRHKSKAMFSTCRNKGEIQ